MNLSAYKRDLRMDQVARDNQWKIGAMANCLIKRLKEWFLQLFNFLILFLMLWLKKIKADNYLKDFVDFYKEK